MRALVVFEKKIVRELLSFFAEGKYLMEVVEADGADQAVQILASEGNAFDLVICELRPTTDKLFDQVFGKGDTVHFLCSTDAIPKGALYDTQKDWIRFLDPNNLLVALNNEIKRLFNNSIRDTRPAELQFARLRVPLAQFCNPLPGDIFHKLGDDRYLRLFRKGGSCDAVDVAYFQSRRKLGYLYVRAGDVINYTVRLHGVISGKHKAVPAPADSRTDAERARLYDEAIEKPNPAQVNPPLDPTPAQPAARKPVKAPQPAPDRSAQFESIAHVVPQELTTAMEEVVKATNDLGFKPEVQELTWTNILEVIDLVRRNPRLSVVLNPLRRERGEYIASHSLLIAHVSCAIATQLEWTNEQTYQKLTLAAFLHDLTLKNQELAGFQTIEELNDRTMEFSDEEIQAFVDHPQTGAAIARSMAEVPPDVDVIISQHHETPIGTGFPRALTHTRIAPLSAVFIIAHHFVHFLLAAKKPGEKFTPSDLGAWITCFQALYDQGNFRKVMVALEKIKA